MQPCAHDGPMFIVINPGSGKDDDEDARVVIAKLLGAVGREHTFFVIDDPEHIEDVAKRAVAAAVQRRGVVVAVGGDGTVSAVAHAVLGSGLAFGVVPQGTFNYFGRAHGISQEIDIAVGALLRARPQPVQVGRVNGQLFLVNASVGLYPELLENRERHKEKYGRSRWVAMCSGLWTLLHATRELRLQIESEQGERELRTPTLFVGNNALQLEQIGIAEADALSHHQGRLAAIVIRPIGIGAMLGLAMRGALGRLGAAENVDSFSFRRLRVDPLGKRRIKVATDGEIRMLSTPLTFDVAADPLMLMVPASDDLVKVA